MNRSLGSLLIAFLATPAVAQPIVGHATSLECFVLDADLVFVGRIEAYGRPDDQGISQVTVVVDERLKGEHEPRREVRMQSPAKTLGQWKHAKSNLLIASRGDDRFGVGKIDLSADDLAVFRSDQTLLRKPAVVVEAARKIVRAQPGVTRIQSFGRMLPFEAMRDTPWGVYSQVTLVVPVDAELERWAHRAATDGPAHVRDEAVRALRFFDTPENRKLVASRLDDESTAIRYRAQENQGTEVKVYLVRQAAHETLNYWGVPHETPEFTVERWLPGEVTLAGHSNTKVTPAELKKLRRFPNLKMLFLWNSEFEGKVFEEIAALGSLEELYLDGTATTDANLANLLKLRKLRYVGLDGTHITGKGLATLAKIESLDKLTLDRVKGIGDADIEQFRAARPDVTIER